MIADWGIASIKQLRLNAIAGVPPTAESVQSTFNNMGTLIYMAPERFQAGFMSSIASDVYSLGMIYLEMLTGSIPVHTNNHRVQTVFTSQYLIDAAKSLRLAAVPKSISSLILSMISFAPSDRPSDYRVLRSSIVRATRKSLGLFTGIFH